MPTPPLKAVVWDFDNTLVDTRARNRSVTRRIIATVTRRDPDEFEALRSQTAYDLAIHRTQNWQHLYRDHFALSSEMIEAAGALWTRYQREDDTPNRWYDGVADAVRSLDRWPQAIVSMNTRANIRAALADQGLASAFSLVIGCEEVGYDRQKPEPDGLLHCLERLTDLGAGVVLYVGDHPVDAQCAANANLRLAARGVRLRVVAVGAAYGTAAGTDPWPVEPSVRVASPRDVLLVAAAHGARLAGS